MYHLHHYYKVADSDDLTIFALLFDKYISAVGQWAYDIIQLDKHAWS